MCCTMKSIMRHKNFTKPPIIPWVACPSESITFLNFNLTNLINIESNTQNLS